MKKLLLIMALFGTLHADIIPVLPMPPVAETEEEASIVETDFEHYQTIMFHKLWILLDDINKKLAVLAEKKNDSLPICEEKE